MGGMLGAMLRFQLGRWWNDRRIPLGTFAANFSGGLLLGWLIHVQGEGFFPEWLWYFLATGFCGGYTTYSTFSFEIYQLIQEQLWTKAILYGGISIGATCTGILFML
nr:CrcB family protein [Halobacillus locisalis]